MHAAMFQLDLGDGAGSRERGRSVRAMAAALGTLPGFVAFLALEAEDGSVGGLCIFTDAAALERAQQHVADWQPARQPPESRGFAPLIAGQVIVQSGF